jgi:hypothetical protein
MRLGEDVILNLWPIIFFCHWILLEPEIYTYMNEYNPNVCHLQVKKTHWPLAVIGRTVSLFMIFVGSIWNRLENI